MTKSHTLRGAESAHKRPWNLQEKKGKVVFQHWVSSPVEPHLPGLSPRHSLGFLFPKSHHLNPSCSWAWLVDGAFKQRTPLSFFSRQVQCFRMTQSQWTLERMSPSSPSFCSRVMIILPIIGSPLLSSEPGPRLPHPWRPKRRQVKAMVEVN